MTAPERALRPLRAVADDLARLRAAQGDAAVPRDALLRVGAATEATLRRLLRDDPAADLGVRLSSLAPDEIAADQVLAELRRRDRISLRLAAAVHELTGARDRARRGESHPDDAALAVSVAEALEAEVRSAPAEPAARSAEPADPAPPSGAPGREEPAPSHPPARPPGTAGWIAVALALLVLGAVAVWWRGERREEATFAEAISRFRSGDLEGAASRFRVYAAEHPDEVTPRLYLARIGRRTGRLEEAADELRRGLAVAPEDAALHRELGFLLLDGGQSAAATARFRVATRLDPDAPDGWVGLVRALRAEGRPDEAARVLARAPAELRAAAGATGAIDPPR